MTLVTSAQSMNSRATNTTGCWGTLQLLRHKGKLTMVAHGSISHWVGVWALQRPARPEAAALATCWHNVCILPLVSFARSLCGSQQALFKCHGYVIHLLGLNMDCGAMQGTGFLCSYYNVISGFRSGDKGPLSLQLHVSWVRLALEFCRSGWETPLSPPRRMWSHWWYGFSLFSLYKQPGHHTNDVSQGVPLTPRDLISGGRWNSSHRKWPWNVLISYRNTSDWK